MRKKENDFILSFAFIGEDKKECEKIVKEQCPIYLVIDIMTSPEATKRNLILWFAENDIVGAEAIAGVKLFAEGLKKAFSIKQEDIDDYKHRIEKSPKFMPRKSKNNNRTDRSNPGTK